MWKKRSCNDIRIVSAFFCLILSARNAGNTKVGSRHCPYCRKVYDPVDFSRPSRNSRNLACTRSYVTCNTCASRRNKIHKQYFDVPALVRRLAKQSSRSVLPVEEIVRAYLEQRCCCVLCGDIMKARGQHRLVILEKVTPSTI